MHIEINVKSFLNLLYLQWECPEGATYSAAQLESAGAKAAQILANAGYCVHYTFSPSGVTQANIRRVSDGADWYIAARKFKNELDGSQNTLNAALGWFLLSNESNVFTECAGWVGQDGWLMFITGNFPTYICDRAQIAGNRDADKLNRQICEATQIAYNYSAVGFEFEFWVHIDPSIGNVFACIAQNILPDFDGLADALADVCLRAFQVEFSKLPLELEAFGNRFDPPAIQLSGHFLPKMRQKAYKRAKWREWEDFRPFLKDGLLRWAKAVLA